MSKPLVPWYDERFRATRYDRLTHLQHLASLEFTAVVHQNCFLVHLPHPPTKAKRFFYSLGLANTVSRQCPPLADSPS